MKGDQGPDKGQKEVPTFWDFMDRGCPGVKDNWGWGGREVSLWAKWGLLNSQRIRKNKGGEQLAPLLKTEGLGS